MDENSTISDRPPSEKWAISAKLEPLRGGHRNRVLRTVGLARDVVFKSTKRSQASIEWLGSVHHLATMAGFVVPHGIRSLNGNLIEDGWTCEALVRGTKIVSADLVNLKTPLLKFHKAAAHLAQRPQFQSSGALRMLSSGGDVDLQEMPTALVRKCREAWDKVADRPQGIIHGDLSLGNVLRTSGDRFALLDWDESRRDLLLFDTGQIEADDEAGRQARLAWEVACSWMLEPRYARALAERL